MSEKARLIMPTSAEIPDAATPSNGNVWGLHCLVRRHDEKRTFMRFMLDDAFLAWHDYLKAHQDAHFAFLRLAGRAWEAKKAL